MDKNDLPEIRVSFSSLSWLLNSPAYYQAKVNHELPKEESKYMDFGKAIHCYMLRTNDFPKEYFVFNAQSPINAQQRAFCEFLKDKNDYLEAYKSVYSIKGKTTKTIEDEASKLYMILSPYIQSFKDAEGKITISIDDFNRIVKMSDNALSHQGVKKLFDYVENHKDSILYTEKEFLYKAKKLHDDKDLFVHGFIDHLIFDPKNRKIIVNELKTTSEHPSKYRESFEKYHTARQLAMYTIAASKIFEKEFPDIPLKEMTPEWNVIVMQSNELYEVKVYGVNDAIIGEGLREYADLINRYAFHYKEGWNYSQEYYTNEGIEYL